MILMMLLMALPILGIALFFLLPWKTALPLYVFALAVSAVYHRAMMRSRKLRVTTGREGMIGRTATVISWRAHRGTVRCDDEIWTARSLAGGPLAPGTRTAVVEVQGLVLIVRPLEEDRGEATGTGAPAGP